MEAKRTEKTRTFCDTPKVFASFNDAAVGRLDILGTTNDGEWYRISEDTRMLSAGFILSVNRRLVDTNTLNPDNFTNL